MSKPLSPFGGLLAFNPCTVVGVHTPLMWEPCALHSLLCTSKNVVFSSLPSDKHAPPYLAVPTSFRVSVEEYRPLFRVLSPRSDKSPRNRPRQALEIESGQRLNISGVAHMWFLSVGDFFQTASRGNTFRRSDFRSFFARIDNSGVFTKRQSSFKLEKMS